MLIDFFYTLRREKLPVTPGELFSLIDCLRAGYAYADMEQFYQLARMCMVKDEKHFDRFDRAFSAYFGHLEQIEDWLKVALPDEWLREQFESSLSAEERERIEALGGLEALLDAFRQRLQEQRERHHGGNKWIGSGGTSPFGAYGYNPEGVRIGQQESRHQRAVKVWDQRRFRDLDESQTLDNRNMKMALRRLRRFARTGSDEELDLDSTISATARKGGWLDIHMVPQRRNAVKVLLFFDVGGSMDPHVRTCEALFSAARTEFRHLEYFYFHNFIYEAVWKKNRRREAETTAMSDILARYGRDYRVIFIGDASMAPYEVTHAGGSIEHYNEEPGAVWMQRVSDHFEHLAWLNPIPEQYWPHSQSTTLIRQLVGERMFPLTMEGLDRAIAELRR